jgi:diadenosine tetraphosphatase ApaH/serine/threonine PP2A family protein phosphatase
VIVLGDIVGYGADPDAVIGRLSDRDAIAIAGNHDLAATGAFDVSWFNEVAAAAIAWTSETMSSDAKAYLQALSPRRDTASALLVHGSVRDPVAEYLLAVPDAAASFALDDFPLAFFGHTHLPTVFRAAEDGSVNGRVLDENIDLTLAPGDRYMVNPGSVGQPRDRDPRAAFMIWDDGRVTGRRVAYPIETAARKILDAGLPRWLAERLALGE